MMECSLAVQWLGLPASTEGGLDLISAPELRSHMLHSAEEKKNRKRLELTILIM